jgi:hypothetical protein
MTYDELRKSMKLAYVDPKKEKNNNRLGKFGLGMKTAASSLGSKFTIKTKYYKNDKDEIFSLVYDEKEFLRKDKWEIEPVKEKNKKFKHGTLIRIENLSDRDTNVYWQKVRRMNEMFSMQYGPYIKAGELIIKIDTLLKKDPIKEIECFKYNLFNNERVSISFSIEGKKVKGWVGFLKHGHPGLSKGFFGFNLFWRNRLVAQHEHIGFRPHAETWRLVGELHLNEFPVTNDKKDFIWSHHLMEKLTGKEIEGEAEGTYDYKNGELFKHVEESLKKFKTYQNSKRIVKKDINTSREREKISLAISKKLKKDLEQDVLSPQEVKEQLNEAIQVASELKSKEEIIKETLEKIDRQEKESSYKPSLKEEKKKEFDFSSPVFEFKINDQNYKVYHNTESLGNKKREFLIDSKKDDQLLVISNLDHPAIIYAEDLNFVYDYQRIEAITLHIIRIKKEKEDIETFFDERDKVYREYFKQKNAREKKKELEKEKEKCEKDSVSEF